MNTGTNAGVLNCLQHLADELLTPVIDLTYEQSSSQKNNFDIHFFQNRVRATITGNFKELCSEAIEVGNKLLKMSSIPPGADFTDYDGDRLIEDLTLVWIILYFLGIPFIHPWEVVLRSIEEIGFPRGASICKACGDIYRSARRASRYRRHSMADESIYFVDHNPLALNRLCDRESSEIRHKSAILGACYELLQLRLYVAGGHPICHLVLRENLRTRLLIEQTRGDRIDQLWGMIQLVYGSSGRQGQTVRVIDADDFVLHMPGCVIGTRAGIFRTQFRHSDSDTTRPSDSDVHSKSSMIVASGNYLKSREIIQYRQRLSGHKAAQVVVSAMRQVEFSEFCHSMFKR
jgi:hypothetical protein